MFYALDKNDIRIHISETSNTETYFCQICNQKLKLISEHQRNGQNISAHFSHIGKPSNDSRIYIPCTDTWHYCKSEWHLAWQNMFPKEFQERVVSNGVEKHIADVLLNDTVVEFQHSSISIKEFRERNDFYNECGYDVIWVFDLSDQISRGIIKIDRLDNSKFYWRSVPKFFRQLCVTKEKAIIVFQLLKTDNKENRVLIRLSNAYKEMSEFYSKEAYSIKEFVDEITMDVFAPEIVKQKQLKKIQEGYTILELWRNDYYGMVVKNQITGQEMVINGIKGIINRDGEKIIGKYSSKNSSGKYTYSDFYPVKDSHLPIWKLIRIFPRTDEEYLTQKKLH